MNPALANCTNRRGHHGTESGNVDSYSGPAFSIERGCQPAAAKLPSLLRRACQEERLLAGAGWRLDLRAARPCVTAPSMNSPDSPASRTAAESAAIENKPASAICGRCRPRAVAHSRSGQKKCQGARGRGHSN